MTKKFLLCFCLCCALIVGMACPAFAASNGGRVPPVVFEEYVFIPGEDDIPDWYQYSLGPEQFLLVPDCDTFVFWLNDVSYVCKTRFDASGNAYYGNFDLLDSDDGSADDYPDTGEPFVFFGDENGATLILDSAYDTLYFSVEPVYSNTEVETSISSGIGGVIRFAGKVVTSLFSPDGALVGLLPVIGMSIGLALVVWGIKKFKSCTWGF